MRRNLREIALGGAAFAALLSGDLRAWAAEPVDVEEITVTGSNIRGAEEAGVVNVQVVDREQLESHGAIQMADLIKDIPSNAGTTQYNETGQLTGTAQFELRGLGFSSTLVLVNGRRAGVAALTDKSGADFVDINQFPLAMVTRLEVLKDGSSAIYGSEAVAGVVNLITRKGFEGFEVSADYEEATNKVWALNLATGQRFERGSFNLYATYYGQTGNVRSDFPWLIERVGGDGDLSRSQLTNPTGFPTSWQLATVNASGQGQVVSGALKAADPNCLAAGGVFPLTPSGVIDRNSCNFDFTDQIGVVPKERRLQAFLESEFQVTDRVTYFNELSISRNRNRLFQHAGSFSNGAAVGGLVFVPASHPFNFFVQDPANPRNIIAIDPAQWNSSRTAVPVVASLRVQGSYVADDKRQTNTYVRAVNGVDVILPRDWRATLSHAYASAEFQERNPLTVNATALNSLLASGQYNPFATSVLTPGLISPKDGRSVAGTPDSVLSQIFYTSNLSRRTEQHVADLSVSGVLFSLPTGDVSMGLGAQYREQSLRYTPDSLSAAGLGNSSAKESSFSKLQQVWSGYAEAIVPLHDQAALQLAIRHEDYGAGVGSTTDPKVTGRVNLFSDRLQLRASWGTSFQAPTLAQNVSVTVLSVLNDPVISTPAGLRCTTGTANGGVSVVTTGGNLKPQSSTNYNVGFDVHPASRLKLSADYWRYDYRDLIAAGQNAQAIINGECVNGQFVSDPRVQRLASGNINQVTTAYVNVGKVITDGVDLSARYDLPLDDLGELQFGADATYVNKFDVFGANGVAQHRVGSRNFNNNFAPMPRWRGNARAAWTIAAHRVDLTVNYIGRYRNDQSNNGPVSPFTTVDLQYTARLDELLPWAAFGSTALSVGAKNLLDRDPPALRRRDAAGNVISGTITDVDRPGYDPLGGANIQGRFVYVRLKQTF